MIKVSELKRLGVAVVAGDMMRLPSMPDYKVIQCQIEEINNTTSYDGYSITEFAWRENISEWPDFDGVVVVRFSDGETNIGKSSRLTWAKSGGVDDIIDWKPCMKSLLAQIESGESAPVKTENSGGACDYYRVMIYCPYTDEQEPYVAECGDIMEALGLTYNEAQEFKEIWRTAAARTLGKGKEGNNPKRAAEKRVFFATQDLKRIIKLGN